MVDVLFSPVSPISEYPRLLGKNISIIMPTEKGKNNILLLPEGLDINPSLTGFAHRYTLPIVASATIDSYIEHFFYYNDLDAVQKQYTKIIAVGASAAYLHSSLKKRLLIEDGEIKLLENKKSVTFIKTENLYLNLLPLEKCYKDVIRFIEGKNPPTISILNGLPLRTL